MINRDGRRFVDETAPYGILDSQIREEGDMAFAVFDDAALETATAAGVARYKQTIPGSTKRQSPHWNADVVEQMVKEGRVASATTTSKLATALSVPVSNLEGTVAHYNAGVELGVDAEYLKDAKFLEPIATPPFYDAELRPATVASTARAAHRSGGQRPWHRRPRHPRSLRRWGRTGGESSALSTSAVETTTPTAPSSVAWQGPRRPR